MKNLFAFRLTAVKACILRTVCAHILVAEDNVHQAELVRRYLEHDGHSVVVVHDGRAAIDETRRRNPDLLVLEIGRAHV